MTVFTSNWNLLRWKIWTKSHYVLFNWLFRSYLRISVAAWNVVIYNYGPKIDTNTVLHFLKTSKITYILMLIIEEIFLSSNISVFIRMGFILNIQILMLLNFHFYFTHSPRPWRRKRSHQFLVDLEMLYLHVDVCKFCWYTSMCNMLLIAICGMKGWDFILFWLRSRE